MAMENSVFLTIFYLRFFYSISVFDCSLSGVYIFIYKCKPKSFLSKESLMLFLLLKQDLQIFIPRDMLKFEQVAVVHQGVNNVVLKWQWKS